MQQPLHEAYTDNEKKTLRFLKEYDSANKEIEAELFDTYRKMNVENPLISDFYRFGHLQKLQDKIQKAIQQLGNSEEDYLKGRMKQGLVLGIETVINKMPETELNMRAVDQMIMRPWQGGSFSDRVWKNKNLLVNQLNDKLRNGIIQGKSPFQIANDLSERMQVGRYQAQRLVRTEYMHVLNQGQIEGYKAKGYTKLKWHASKDERTCEICGKHHGNEYDIDEAPHLPAHPGCRCTFVPVIDVESAAEELKQARDELNSIRERSIIELGVMYKKSPYRGICKNATIPRKLSAIRRLIHDAGISLEGIKIKLEPDESWRGSGMLARADGQHIGRVDLLPDVFFLSEEEFLKTIVHEREHVRQYRKYGARFVQNNMLRFEREAEEAENKWIAEYRKRKRGRK